MFKIRTEALLWISKLEIRNESKDAKDSKQVQSKVDAGFKTVQKLL